MDEMIVPYIAEDGLAVALGPTLLGTFARDERAFYMDTEADWEEPRTAALDTACNDRKTGPEKL